MGELLLFLLLLHQKFTQAVAGVAGVESLGDSTVKASGAAGRVKAQMCFSSCVCPCLSKPHDADSVDAGETTRGKQGG